MNDKLIIEKLKERVSNLQTIIRHCDSPTPDNPRFEMVLELTKKDGIIKSELSLLEQNEKAEEAVKCGSCGSRKVELIQRCTKCGTEEGIEDHSASTTMSKYEIDFAGNVMAEVQIQDNKPTVLRAINGFGELINPEMIILNSKSEE